MKTGVSTRLKDLYRAGVIKRSIVVWVLFQAVLWVAFALSFYTHRPAWNVVQEAGMGSYAGSTASLFVEIIGRNSVLVLLIALGNIFVRFGPITPGLFILVIQGITIGFVAGTNSFEFPFISVAQANLQYLKVGLWETTAYAIICAVTLTKSLNIADSFPARRWVEVRSLRDITFTTREKAFALAGILLLIMAAYIETHLIIS